MIDRPLEERLRDWYHDDIGTEEAPLMLRAAVSVIPEIVPSTRWLIGPLAGPPLRVLLVAALLAAVLVTGIVFVGTQLLRTAEPRIDEPVRFVGAACIPSEEAAVAADDVLTLEDRNATPGFEGERDGAPGKRTILLRDGRLITEPIERTKEQIVSGLTGATERRLTPRGIELMLDGIDRSRLAVPGCHYDLRSEGALRLLDVRLTDRQVASTHWGNPGGPFPIEDPMSADDRRAIDALQARIEHPEDWLPPEALADAAARPMRPEGWRIVVHLVPPSNWSAYGDKPRSGPTLADFVSVGGPDLRDFGSPIGRDANGADVRCAVVDAVGGRSVLDRLVEADAPLQNTYFWLTESGVWVLIQVQPITVHPLDCSADALQVVSPGASPHGEAP